MATREDRVYRLDEVGQNQLIQNSFDTTSFAESGGGGGGGSVLAFDPYTSPYVRPRRIFFTINTYTNLSRTDIVAKAYLNGVEIEDQTNSKGRVTFSLDEQRLLNPSTLTLVSGDLKPQKYFLIQSRKDIENEVSVIEVDNIKEMPILGAELPLPGGIAFGGDGSGGGFVDTRGGQYDGSGGSVTRGGGGGFTGGGYEDGRGGLGRDLYVADMNQRENLQ